VAPRALREEQPQLYDLFVDYFRQDPGQELPPPPEPAPAPA